MSDRDTEFVWRKWDGTPHWRYEMVHLGSDEHGDWFGQSAGAQESRPGVVTVMWANRVALVPTLGSWIATFHEPSQKDPMLTYVDVASQVEYDRSAGVVTAIDMDLDVIKTDDERATWIDDEDEFEERIVSMAYPQSEIKAARQTAANVLEAVRGSRGPFDGRHEKWLGALASLL